MPAPTDSVAITALPAVVTAAGADIFPVVQAGVTSRETNTQLLTFIQGAIALNASAITAGTLAVARGGTGLGAFTIGDLIVADGATSLAKLADVAVGNVLRAGGVGVAPAWGQVVLTTDVTGILPSANGGTGVNNAGTLTNASNTTITGGGTLALAGFTLTVPATLTAAGLAIANVFTLAQTAQRNAIGAVSTDGLILTNATAAAAGAQQFSPRLRLTGQGWKTTGTASVTVDWTIENVPIQGAANPTTALVISNQVAGAGYTERLRMVDNGQITLTPASGATGININVSSGFALNVSATSGSGIRASSSAGGNGLEGNTSSTGLGGSFSYTGSAAAAVQTIVGIDNAGSNGGTNAGARWVMRSRSATVAATDQADLTTVYVDGTHISRKSRLTVNVFDTAARIALVAEASGSAPMIGFLGAAAVARQTGGENLTNNVASGGTDGTIANYTDLTIYANDAAAIRNDIYQLARMLKQDHDALRLYGFLT